MVQIFVFSLKDGSHHMVIDGFKVTATQVANRFWDHDHVILEHWRKTAEGDVQYDMNITGFAGTLTVKQVRLGEVQPELLREVYIADGD